ncbi:MAG: response regulator transcription factor [Pirellulales bacterium]
MSGRILVVEDEARIADFLVRGLTEEGYAAEHAADGREAALRLRTSAYDLVILDWWLPGEDGLHVLRTFRQTNRTTPVLFLTARDAVAERVTGLDAGADDYLTKPFSFEELLARIRAHLRRPSQANSVVIEFQDVRIDMATQKATARRAAVGSHDQRIVAVDVVPAQSAQSSLAPRGFTKPCGTKISTDCPTRWRSTSRNCGASWKRAARD